MAMRAKGIVRTIAILLVVAAAGVGVAAGVYNFLQPGVTVTQPTEGPVVQAFYATGTISPEREYVIKAAVAGIATEVRVDKGQAVKQGDVLAVLKNDEMPMRLKQAEAELWEKQQLAAEGTSPILREFDAKLAALQELLAIAERERKRVSDALEKNAAAQADLDHALDRLKTVWSDLESTRAQRATRKLSLERELIVAQAASDIAQWNYDQLTLKAPITGVVLDRPVAAGTHLNVNDPLMRVADIAPANLVMRAAVDEEDKVKVSQGLASGMKVYMRLYSYQDRKPFEGTVARVYPQADPDRRTFEVDVRLSGPDAELAPGMTGELNFVMARKDVATVVPSQAIQDGAIWVVRSGKLERIDAQFGLRSVERVELLTPLRANDVVVISPVGKMRPGQAVRISERMDPLAAAGLNKPAEKSNFRGFN